MELTPEGFGQSGILGSCQISPTFPQDQQEIHEVHSREEAGAASTVIHGGKTKRETDADGKNAAQFPAARGRLFACCAPPHSCSN
ncbi:hypothetical protein NDU88_001308 [Pleurodeles waltl]|uniref:Uncharacterized protein n=1 Tax=Pleurodeles waltl TaxID=8319 RepID=A0AAV7ND23_PLEWA|nr:hypothetical protein NDU88_001308 [Pleurodeles waltl]